MDPEALCCFVYAPWKQPGHRKTASIRARPRDFRGLSRQVSHARTSALLLVCALRLQLVLDLVHNFSILVY